MVGFKFETRAESIPQRSLYVNVRPFSSNDPTVPLIIICDFPGESQENKAIA